MKVRSSGQVALPLEIFREPDRNFERGGRSFYFFDFDDNVVHLATQILIFPRTRVGEPATCTEPIGVSTHEFPEVVRELGKPGTRWENFELRYHDTEGSFRNFRELPPEIIGERDQPLVEDMIAALEHPHLEWRGPSWEFFKHAVNNNRPVSIITARGNHPHTIRRALNILRNSNDLAACPNYLSLYPVSYIPTRRELGDEELKWSTGQLKKAAIRRAVHDAFACYGVNPHHRFGMSDDDPANIALILEAMEELKREHPHNAFFVINTQGRQLLKKEVIPGENQATNAETPQMELFEL
jgi:hypothetical protein